MAKINWFKLKRIYSAISCECGCGEYPKKGKNYIQYHHLKNGNHPKGMLGKTHSEKSKLKTSKAIKEFYINGGQVWNKGKDCLQLSEASKKVWQRPGHRQKMSEAHKDYIMPEEQKQKIGDGNRGKIVPEEVGKKISKAKKGIATRGIGWNHSEETIEKIKKGNKENWHDPEFVSKMIKASQIKPNKAECKLFDIVDSLFPGEYHLNPKGEMIIAGKIPDIVNINGQKKIIELYGDYWHRNDDPQDRIDIFKPFGYQTLVIWESELKNLDKLKITLGEFHNGKG